MRRLAVFATVLAGCSFAATTGDVPGDGASDGSPSDGVLTDGAPADVPVPLIDTDADGVVDASDNCPVLANANQRDHDADARGDACDRCPHLASTNDPDGDSDGVGDACDPRPALPGDLLVTWDGFYDDSTAATAWTKLGGTWSVAGGKLRQTDAQTVAFISPPTTVDRIYLAYAFDAITVGPAFTISINGNSRTIYPTVGDFAGVVQQTHNYGCAITKDPTNNVVAWASFGGNTQSSAVAWAADLVAGQRFTIVQTLAATNRCEFARATTTASDTEAVDETNGTMSLFVTAAAVDFDYVFIVSMGS
ncbi:MAG: thrombospondin type 3 repeat-containing protein [Myxococcota bacterium]|nr:thrombospondin type 3 repeat-containing protein [Myxococcota bacterium]